MPSGEPKILIVDDEKKYLTDLRALYSKKFDIVTAATAEEALRLLEEGGVGVVISDQRMPRMTGSQLLTVVNSRYPKTVRILLTAYCDMDALVEAVNEGGIYRYVTKDTPLPEIERVMRQAVERFKEMYSPSEGRG